MKRTVMLALAALLLSMTAAAQTAQRDTRFRVFGVAFYNLENLFDTINNNGTYDLEFSPEGARQWDGRKYRAKLENMARVIAAMTTKATPQGPAVIGVSEIENRTVLDDLVKQPSIRSRMYQVIHHDSPDRRGVDVGLLYNPRLFRPLNVTNHTLRIEGYERFRTRDQMCVTGILGGDTISIIVNHWPSRLGGQQQSSYLREAAAALSKHIADSLWALRPNQAVIVMGDLNDDPGDKSCAEVLGACRNPKDVIGKEQAFYNPFWKVLDDGIGTLAYKGSWNLFDQIIVSSNLVEGNAAPGHLTLMRPIVWNLDFLFDREGTRAGSPLRTYSGGMWLNGFSDHFPTEVLLKQEVITD